MGICVFVLLCVDLCVLTRVFVRFDLCILVIRFLLGLPGYWFDVLCRQIVFGVLVFVRVGFCRCFAADVCL